MRGNWEDALRRAIGWLASAVLLAGIWSAGAPTAHAAVTDCRGMSVDGQAACTPPTFAPTQYWYGSYLSGTMPGHFEDCRNQLGFGVPSPDEASAIAVVSCANQAVGGPAVSGPIPWLADGTPVSSAWAWSGTVTDFEGHHIWGAGFLNVGGPAVAYSFLRTTTSTCPDGWDKIGGGVDGQSITVRCRPCPGGMVQSPSRPNVCDTVVMLRWCEPCQKGTTVGDPIVPMTGASRQYIESGLKLAGRELVLTYDTSPMLDGFASNRLPSFGMLWSSTFHRTLTVSVQNNIVVAMAFRGDGKAMTFTQQGGGAFVADANVNDRLTAVSGGYQYIDAAAQAVESYTSQGQLTRIDNADGTWLTFTYSTGQTADAPTAGYLMQVADHTGRTLSFKYALPAIYTPAYVATRGLISSATDSSGRSVRFVYGSHWVQDNSYDAHYNLTAVNWPDGKVLQFAYEDTNSPWAMTGRIDENGDREASWTFDPQGRAAGVSRGGGADAYSITYASPPVFGVSETEDTVHNILYRRYGLTPATGISISTPNGQQVGWNSSTVLGGCLYPG